ncbi:hypothetical protein PR048_031694 [Dryococelus australis]|uniref:Uncharacterized protein n=1 Tax=Dryococelus australis TaxID=614101 RepID=A0ABQ9G608_9NEOP|nr:hypothetical protein PR048_031694 [Dryococelus australis]
MDYQHHWAITTTTSSNEFKDQLLHYENIEKQMRTQAKDEGRENAPRQSPMYNHWQGQQGQQGHQRQGEGGNVNVRFLGARGVNKQNGGRNLRGEYRGSGRRGRGTRPYRET